MREQQEKIESPLEAFWQEMGKDPQAVVTIKDPEFLTNDDRKIWEKIGKGTITFPEFDSYRTQVNKELREEAGGTTDGKETLARKNRLAFLELAADRANSVLNQWLLDHPEKHK